MDLSKIEKMGEESGREEASDDFPHFSRIDKRKHKEYKRIHYMLTRYGRGRAQGPIYELRGKSARIFAHNWAMGYLAQIDLFKREGMLKV